VDCQFLYIQEHRLSTSSARTHAYPLLGRNPRKSRKLA
jgi:hypothetical protein